MRGTFPLLRSARKSAVNDPVICQSGEVLSAWLVTGSLLTIETMRHVGAGSQLSTAMTDTVTGTIRWLAGARFDGVTEADRIVGAVVSATVKAVMQAVVLPARSVTVIVTAWVPVPTRVPAAGT